MYVSFSETRVVYPQFAMEKPKNNHGFFGRFSRSQGALGLVIRNAREILNHNPDHTNRENL